MGFFSSRRPPEGSENPHPTPIESLINTIADYISPRAREERRMKAIGNPAERQIEQQRIAREESFYRHGMPVAGHNEPVPKNNPTLRRKHPFVP